MRRSIGFFSVMALILGLALAACGGTPAGLSSPEILLSFEGSVTSAVSGVPIQGAEVTLLTSTIFGPLIHGTTFTDAAGRYVLTVHTNRCSGGFFGGLKATAASFRSASEPVVCTTATQTIDFALQP